MFLNRGGDFFGHADAGPAASSGVNEPGGSDGTFGQVIQVGVEILSNIYSALHVTNARACVCVLTPVHSRARSRVRSSHSDVGPIRRVRHRTASHHQLIGLLEALTETLDTK